jgi:uncharacterized protein (DUF1778 family)
MARRRKQTRGASRQLREHTLAVRITNEQRALLERAAAIRVQNVSEYARQTLVLDATQVVAAFAKEARG